MEIYTIQRADANGNGVQIRRTDLETVTADQVAEAVARHRAALPAGSSEWITVQAI